MCDVMSFVRPVYESHSVLSIELPRVIENLLVAAGWDRDRLQHVRSPACCSRVTHEAPSHSSPMTEQDHTSPGVVSLLYAHIPTNICTPVLRGAITHTLRYTALPVNVGMYKPQKRLIQLLNTSSLELPINHSEICL